MIIFFIFASINEIIFQSSRSQRFLNVTILQICKTIYFEIVQIFYAKNIFVIWTSSDFKVLTSWISYHQKIMFDFSRQKIRDAIIDFFDVQSESSFNSLLMHELISFFIFLRDIDRQNAKKFRKIQLKVSFDMFFYYKIMFSKIIRQHMSTLIHLIVNWNLVKCYRKLWKTRIDFDFDFLNFAISNTTEMWNTLKCFKFQFFNLKKMTFLNNLTKFDAMTKMIIRSRLINIIRFKEMWSSMIESFEKFRIKKKRDMCMCSDEKCDER